MKKIFLLSLLILAGIIVGNYVFASNATLSVIPSSGSKTVGQTISVSVQLNPSANSVCVVKGTLVFENTTCQSITVGSGFMTQVSPTCSNPTFTLGIAGCSTNIQNLLTVSAKVGSAGAGKISLSGVKIIGAGADVAFSTINGSYDIVAAKPVEKAEVVNEAPAETQEVQPSAEAAEEPVVQEESNNQQNLTTGQQASLANSSPTKTIVVSVIILLAIVVVGWFVFRKKK